MTDLAPARVMLCTSGGLYGALVMRRLLADSRVRLVGVVLSSRVLGKQHGWLRGAWHLYRRSGLRYLLYLWAVTGLAELLGALGRLPPVAGLARGMGCPLLVTRDLNDAAGMAFIDRCKPDLLVSGFFNQRIAPHVLLRPPAGAVNVHPSLLPALKGVDPVFYAQLRGISPVGVTLHRMVADLDAGPVLAQSQLVPAVDESVVSVTARLFEQGAGLLLRDLESILGGAPGDSQPDGGSYDSWPTRADVKSFCHSGGVLVSASDLMIPLRRHLSRA
jgi:hypothetical protein